MGSKRCVASKSDYDCYTMHLPLSVILNNRKNNYIHKQLEKMHPCFSKEFCYKSRVRFCKNGAVSDVIVMNNYKVNEYRKKYPNKKIWIPEFQDCFENFGKKRLFIHIFCLLIFLVLFVFVGFIFFSNFAKKEKTLIEDNIKIESISVPESDIYSFLNTVFENNGKISSLLCIKDGNNYVYEVTLNSIFPEALISSGDNLKIGNVIYSDGKPVLSVTSGKIINKKNSNNLTSNQFSAIRKIINENSGQLIKEDINNSIFKFALGNGYEHFNLFYELHNFLNIEQCGLQSLKIDSNENHSLNIEFVLAKDFEGINLEKIFSHKEMFFTPKVRTSFSNNNQIEEINHATSKNRIYDKELLKLGEISKKDGTKIFFYKTKDGKIIKEVINKL